MRILSVLMLAIVANTYANINIPVQFTGPLNQSCSFINDENVLSTIESLTLSLDEIRTNQNKCKSIYTNSKVFLNTITQEMNARSTNLEITNQNIRSIRPGFGLHPKYFFEILGKKVNQDLSKGEPFQFKFIQ